MALSIRYTLSIKRADTSSVRETVRELLDYSRSLPVLQHSKLIELIGTQCHYRCRDSRHASLLATAPLLVDRDAVLHRVQPDHIIAFTALPGLGCEHLHIGLATYPGVNAVTARSSTDNGTWFWQGFCKTSNAAAGELGGVSNFLRCHLSVTRILDRASQLGISVSVEDDGGFWDNRNLTELALHVTSLNSHVKTVLSEIEQQFLLRESD